MYEEIAKEKFDYLVKNHENMDILILAIESSCDETSIAVIKNGTEVLSNVISSQIDIHKRFGGVVPEVASRNHLLALNNVLSEALDKAKVTLSDIHAIAVTYGAGLVGALMVGVNFAKSLAYACNLPLIKVNHIKGHISANYIACPELKPPFISLIVSGGHTALVRTVDYTRNELICTTIDDAVGEAFDKVSKVLGLGYPGGPIVDKMSKTGTPCIELVKSHPVDGFSYSGIKTAVINYVHKCKQAGKEINIPDVCASFEYYAIGQLVDNTIRACKKYKAKTVVMAGGVAANSYLRSELTKACLAEGIEFKFPPMSLCTDNAAMIGCEAYFNLISGVGIADMTLTAQSNLNLKFSSR